MYNGKPILGAYKGKVLVDTIDKSPGDIELLRDKLIYARGLSPEVATKIAAKARWMIGG